MTHTPPVPPGNQSPYPIQPPPQPHSDPDPAAIVATPARDEERIGRGAAIAGAVGLGAALVAIGAALLRREAAANPRRGKGKGKRGKNARR